MTGAWYVIVALMFTAFAVTEGWDFGAGALHLLVARNGAERRQLVQALGPLWSWNEVWLIGAGGVMFLAFPKAFAAALSGTYLAVFLLLWCLVLRGMALEVGGHIQDSMWQSFWDAMLAVSSVLLAVLFGAAFGNVIRGVPLDAEGGMFLPFFTDFTARGHVGILDWYTISVAVFTLVVLAAHGATFLALRLDGRVEERSEHTARRFWLVAAVMLPIVSIETAMVRPGFFAAIGSRPALWLACLVLAGGWLVVAFGMRWRRQGVAFAGSCAVVAGLIAGAAASIYPEILHSTLDPARSITATSGASDAHGLGLAFLWWPVALVLSLAYAGFVAWRIRGKVRVEPDALP